ncbi:cation diffusion facilitator family transporter [Aminobacter sp. DSM 101952]|uniref:cation diffusion facilitator family transporter n=1 Tax=Aminobacter sp. DSM 101952 TaxID=2735891 RepID=UPI0006F493F1|nr:cation transporter [Aminobacter sp. DSM 101952]KQU76372.1 cation diffusion facilitator family transporter [Aminobacter sp. DSM 101952]
MLSETKLLRISIAVTFVVALFGIAFGVLSGSSSIAFDGAYSLADATMTILALIVARLITSNANHNRRLHKRFSLGFWHLEPIVLGMNGIVLMSVSIYALINAIANLLAGGRQLEFDFAIVYAAVTLAACLTMAFIGNRANRTIQSDFVTLDVTAWMMSGGITAALLVAFIGGSLVEGTELAWIAPFVDPAVLALVCLIIIPMPIGTVRQAFSDILLITPEALKTHVDEVARDTVARHGFVSYRAYVAKVGRLMQIELYFIVPPGLPAKTIEAWDRLRDEIGDALGDEGPDRWLTIAFTADREWAE